MESHSATIYNLPFAATASSKAGRKAGSFWSKTGRHVYDGIRQRRRIVEQKTNASALVFFI